ncbi:MAG: hypothetical protein ABH824_04140 [Nanoarchaeota archaeon]
MVNFCLNSEEEDDPPPPNEESDVSPTMDGTIDDYVSQEMTESRDKANRIEKIGSFTSKNTSDLENEDGSYSLDLPIYQMPYEIETENLEEKSSQEIKNFHDYILTYTAFGESPLPEDFNILTSDDDADVEAINSFFFFYVHFVPSQSETKAYLKRIQLQS